MIPRMTTVGTLKNYRYDLNRSNNTLAKAMQTVTTQRNFNSYAENPALAVRCFQIRRSYQRAEAQYTVNESLRHKYDVAWEALGNVSTDLYALAEDTSLTSVIRSLSDPTGPGRTALGQSLCAKAKDMAQTMNGRYGENYVFAGADTLNAPFSWGPKLNQSYIEEFDPTVHEELKGKTFEEIQEMADPKNPDHAAAFQFLADPDKVADGVLYTNKPEEALHEKNGEAMIFPEDPGDPSNPAEYPPDDPAHNKEDIPVPVKNPKFNLDFQYKYIKAAEYITADDTCTGTHNREEAAEALYYRRVPTEYMEERDKEKLEYFEESETKYIDVGLGHKEVDDEVQAATVFDCALQGIDFLGGYGTKDVEIELEDGTKLTVGDIPKNIISVVNEMGLILQRCGKDDGHWASEDDQHRFMALVKEFESGTSTFRERWTEMDTQSGFLRDNSELLESTSDSLIQQYMELEAADPAAAISEYMFARYCFDAALKVGNSILSQSLMDYMNF